MQRKPFKLLREPLGMHRWVSILVAVVLLAGCTASGDGQDRWAYTKKPLYAGGFDLAKLNGTEDAQQFQVTDGSIAAVRMLVWVNATAGGATIVVRDPGGHVMLTTSETTEATSSLNLGRWSVSVTGQPESAGVVHILVVRA